MNIFVAKLSPSTDEYGLETIFSAFGEVTSAKVIMDRDTGRSKCYGFVEMQDDDAGRNAIQELNETVQDGSTIVVKEAEPRRDNNRGGNRYNDRGNNRGRDGHRSSNRRSDRDGGFNTDRW